MLKNPENSHNFQQLYVDVKKYVELQAEYLKVEFVEKMTILISSLLLIIFIIIFSLGALFYFFFFLAYSFEDFFGTLATSFGIISLIYILFIGVLVIMRKQLIINPLVKFLTNLFLNQTKN